MSLYLFLLISIAVIQATGQGFNLYQRFFCADPRQAPFYTFCNFSPNQPRPPQPPRPPRLPPPTTVLTTTTRPRPVPPRGNRPPNSRQNEVQICERRGGRCTDGVFLADMFAVNFLGPPQGGVKTPESQRGGSRSFPTTQASSSNFVGGNPSNNRGIGGGGGSSFSPISGRNLNLGNNNGGGNNRGQGISGRFFSINSNVSPSAPPFSSDGRGRSFGSSRPTARCETSNITNENGQVILGSCIRQSRTSRSFRVKRQIPFKPVYQTKRDLLIMMDESASVGFYRYEKVKRIGAAIVRLLCQDIQVRSDLTRVAVLSFDQQVHPHISLLPRFGLNGNGIANQILRLRYNPFTARATCLLDALSYAYEYALDVRNGGRRGQPFVEQDIIIISDGCENCVERYVAYDMIQRITNFFIAEDIHVYVIGIGIREQCKEVLSLLAQGGRCFHFFYLTNWDYILDDFLRELEFPPPGICLQSFEVSSGQCLGAF